jgi:hydrogenase/urease accessory protein HupE
MAKWILLNIPLAVVGGIAGLGLAGLPISVSALAGFVALFGISIQYGVICGCHCGRAGFGYAAYVTRAPSGNDLPAGDLATQTRGHAGFAIPTVASASAGASLTPSPT